MNRSRLTYSEVARSELFRRLMRKKKRFLIPLTLFFMAFYLTLPVLTSYFEVLNREAVGSITWAWVLAFAQFLMTWALCYVYSRKSLEFDALCEELNRQVQTNQIKEG